jgi:arsenate reductase
LNLSNILSSPKKQEAMKIYHNPRCRKSRETLQIIRDAGRNVEVIEYLKDTPSQEELKEIIGLLRIRPEKLVRKNETLFKENFKGKRLSDGEWIEILANNPKLIERPIVVDRSRAVIGRPPENINELL